MNKRNYNNENKLSDLTNQNSDRDISNSTNENKTFDTLINSNFNLLFSNLLAILPGLVSEAVDARLKLPIGPSKSHDGNGRMGTHESRLRDSSGSRELLFERRRGYRLVNDNEVERRRGDRQEIVHRDEFEIRDVNCLGVSNEFDSRDVNKFNARYERRDGAFDSYSGGCRPDASEVSQDRALASDSAGANESYGRVTHAHASVGTDEDGYTLVQGRKFLKRDTLAGSYGDSKDLYVHKGDIDVNNDKIVKNNEKIINVSKDREFDSGRVNYNRTEQNRKLQGQEGEKNLKKKIFLILPIKNRLFNTLKKTQKKKIFFLRFCQPGLKRRN